MRRRIPSKVVTIKPDIGTVRKTKAVIKNIKPAELPPCPNEIQAPTQAASQPSGASIKSFSPKSFWTSSTGSFSKRAFFFSLFAFTAFAYLVICMIGLVRFSDRLGLFILGCNAAFGLNYYKNERDKDFREGSINVGQPGNI